jgi:hypothetical protein
MRRSLLRHCAGWQHMSALNMHHEITSAKTCKCSEGSPALPSEKARQSTAVGVGIVLLIGIDRDARH